MTAMKLIETVPTEKDAYTLAFDATRNKVYAFLPQTHRAAVFVDGPTPGVVHADDKR
jgi:hypothetical protein